MFRYEFVTLTDRLSCVTDEVIIAGENETKLLALLLHSAQDMNETTHISGHIIDFVVTQKGDNILDHLLVSSVLSDHFVVHYRCLHANNTDDFTNELVEFQPIMDSSD